MTSDSSIKTRISELVEVFSAPDADAAWLLCDRHQPESVAFTFLEPDGSRADLTYGELRERSERFAGVLMGLGVGRGDRVATLMGKSIDLVTVLLGTWRVGAVYVPLFTAFAADAVRSRLQGARVKLVVADAAQTAKVPDGAWTLLVAGTGQSSGDDSAGPASSLADALADAVPFTGSSAIGGDGAFVHMFTSGTTGAPKGVVHPLRYVAGWQAYLEFALGVRADSVYWCGADPGWAYGLYAASCRADGAGPAQHPAARWLRRRGDLVDDGHTRGHRLRSRADGVPGVAHQRGPRARRTAPTAPVQRR